MALALSPTPGPIYVHPAQFSFRAVALLFFLWPNCGYHLAWVLRWLRLLPAAQPPADPYIERMGFFGPVFRKPEA